MRSVAANSFAVSSYQQKASPSPVRNTPPVTSDQFSLTAKTIKSAENHIPKFGMPVPDYMLPTIERSKRHKAAHYQGPVNATAKVDIDRVRYQEDTGEAADRAKLAASSGTTTKKKKKKK